MILLWSSSDSLFNNTDYWNKTLPPCFLWISMKPGKEIKRFRTKPRNFQMNPLKNQVYWIWIYTFKVLHSWWTLHISPHPNTNLLCACVFVTSKNTTEGDKQSLSHLFEHFQRLDILYFMHTSIFTRPSVSLFRASWSRCSSCSGI